MKFWKFCLLILVSAAEGAVAPALFAQGPLFDRVLVDFPHDTHISDQMIPAGHYVLQQMREPSAASHIMLVLKNNGRNYETSAITIPALNNNTPDATRAIIRRVGSNYYLDTIWIAGKNYGYQFELPEEAKKEINKGPETAALSFNYQAPQQAVAAAPPPPPVKEGKPEPVQVAQAPPPPARQPEATAPPPPPEQPARLPQTSSGWANVLGFGVLGIGLAFLLKLRRQRV